jgi:hypothetical protein
MADYTGQPLAKIEEDTDRDRWAAQVGKLILWRALAALHISA